MMSPQESTEHSAEFECAALGRSIDVQFSKLVFDLNNQMYADFHSVNPEANPVAVVHEELNPQQITQVVGQYSWFSKSISKFLLDAFYTTSASRWAGISVSEAFIL